MGMMRRGPIPWIAVSILGALVLGIVLAQEAGTVSTQQTAQAFSLLAMAALIFALLVGRNKC